MMIVRGRAKVMRENGLTAAAVILLLKIILTISRS
jgi:hypothetical protein